MAGKTYSELLRDPAWQKQRLSILNRDGWKCRQCGSTDKTLHVHHLFYEWGLQPWDYPPNTLMALCEDCHSACSKDAHKEAMERLGQALIYCGLRPETIMSIADSLTDRCKHGFFRHRRITDQVVEELFGIPFGFAIKVAFKHCLGFRRFLKRRAESRVDHG